MHTAYHLIANEQKNEKKRRSTILLEWLMSLVRKNYEIDILWWQWIICMHSETHTSFLWDICQHTHIHIHQQHTLTQYRDKIPWKKFLTKMKQKMVLEEFSLWCRINLRPNNFISSFFIFRKKILILKRKINIFFLYFLCMLATTSRL